MNPTNPSGGIVAIAAIIVMLVAKIDPSLNLQLSDVIQVVCIIAGLIGSIELTIKHINQGQALKDATAQIASMTAPKA